MEIGLVFCRAGLYTRATRVACVRLTCHESTRLIARDAIEIQRESIEVEAPTTESKFALIGAGPMGLAAARNLQRFDIPFQGFELHASVGGLWDMDNPQSTVYQSAHLISSKHMTEFNEFPMRAEVADYPHHSELKRYFNDFADHFGLREFYRFNTRVIEVKRGEAGWSVTSETNGERLTETYRGVLIANGTLSEPNVPKFEGEFAGEMLHSAQYKTADIFAGKRVLVIGAGNSGCDIVVDAVHRATKVDISVRRGYHFVPKYVFGRPADSIGGAIKLPMWLKRRIDSRLLGWFTGDPVRFGFPKPDHALYESHPIVNSLILYHIGHGDVHVRADIGRFEGKRVHFADGTSEEYDLILLATGYKLHYPFMDRGELNWQGAAPKLYLNCFHPQRDDIFVLGMIEAAGLGWQGRYDQAELVARYINECDRNSDKARQFRAIKSGDFDDMRGGMNYIKLDRMAYYVHKDTYRSALLRHIAELS